MGTNPVSFYAKLDLKPTPLLLEDKGNKKRSDGHVQIVFLVFHIAALLNLKFEYSNQLRDKAFVTIKIRGGGGGGVFSTSMMFSLIIFF